MILVLTLTIYTILGQTETAIVELTISGLTNLIFSFFFHTNLITVTLALLAITLSLLPPGLFPMPTASLLANTQALAAEFLTTKQ